MIEINARTVKRARKAMSIANKMRVVEMLDNNGAKTSRVGFLC